MIHIQEAHLNIAAGTHPGMTGKKNEDRYGVSAFLTGANRDIPAVLAVLCDGIGGHRAGEVAAQMGVSIITETVTTSDGSQPVGTLEEAINRASHAIYEASLSIQGRKGMGATVACAWVIADRLYTANLGDSRIYLLREGHILQLTTDHTWLQEAFDAGIIDEIQGDSHPNAHVIRRYLGSTKPPKVDFRLWFFDGEGDDDALGNQGLKLVPGDVVLICSDGLTDLVSDEEIHAIIRTNPIKQAPKSLLNLANARGGHDNSTVVLMEFPANQTLLREQAGKNGKVWHRQRWLIGCLVAVMITVLLASGVFFGMRWWVGRSGLLTNTATPVHSTLPTITQPLPTETIDEAQVTVTPTFTAAPMDGLVTPRPTITPWPTHTATP